MSARKYAMGSPFQYDPNEPLPELAANMVEHLDAYEITSSAEAEVLAHLNIQQLASIANSHSSGTCEQQLQKPFLEILEQPQSRGYRFRYKCEGQSHGGLQAEGSGRNQKIFPTIAIRNYKGPQANIRVTLVTASDPPLPHAHEIIGKNCTDGQYSEDVVPGPNGEYRITFPSLSILHATRKSIASILKNRLLEEERKKDAYMCQNLHSLRMDTLLTEQQVAKATRDAEEQAKTMQMNALRLKFEASMHDQRGTHYRSCVVSTIVYDSKSTTANPLKISRIDKLAGSCAGGEEVFLLCSKVQKDDIRVKFFELEDSNHGQVWDAYGKFSPADVHRQSAIVFKTPPYKDRYIQQNVIVLLKLFRPSDEEDSEPLPFTYHPNFSEQEEIGKKRHKPTSWDNNFGRPFQPPPSAPQGGSGQQSGKGGQGGSSGTMAAGGSNVPNTFLHRVDGASGCYEDSEGICYSMGHGNFDSQHSSCRFVTDLHHQQEGERKPTSDLHGTAGLPVSLLLADNCHIKFDLPSEGLYTDSPDATSMEGITGAEKSQGNDEAADTVGLRKRARKEDGACAIPESEKIGVQPLLDALNHLFQLEAGALQSYVCSGDVRFLLASMHHLTTTQDDAGDNALHLAVIHNQQDALRSLLGAAWPTLARSGAINQRNDSGQTPLHVSIILGLPRIAELLLCHGADPSVRDYAGNNAWHLAARNGNVAVLRVIPCAAEAVPPRARAVNALNYEGYCPLHLAVLGRHLDCIKQLVASNADVDLADGKSGRSSLHFAVECESLGIVGYLVAEAGAHVDQPLFDGNTPLHLACSLGLPGITTLLIAAGADTLAQNCEAKDDCDMDTEARDDEARSGQTPFDLARGNKQILAILERKPSSSCTSACVPVHAEEFQESVGHYSKSTDDGIEEMDEKTRALLAATLDASPEGWASLASSIGLGQLVDELRAAKSPAKALLDSYEALDGTIDKLRTSLAKLKLSKAMEILARSSKTAAVDAQHDSGIGVSGAHLNSC